MNQKLMCFNALGIMILVMLVMVNADPESPTNVQNVSDQQHTNNGVYLMSGNGAAQAGNVTYINLTAKGVTRIWAGYYGNITGTLVLENSNNQMMYSWALTNPGGKVIASQKTISNWNIVSCWNWSPSVDLEGLRSTEWNSFWNVSTTDVDRIQSTFSASYKYDNFTIGHKKFDANDVAKNDGENQDLCPAIQLYNETGQAPSANTHHQFEEIILTNESWSIKSDMKPNQLIYVSIISGNTKGFNGQTIDFQIIVPNDQHEDRYKATPYYFYVELEAS